MRSTRVLWFACVVVFSSNAALGRDAAPAADSTEPKQVASILGPSKWDFVELELYAYGGDTNAQFRIGLHYLFGDGVVPDAAKAIQWFRMAADAGHGRAAYQLATLYREGRSVARDTSAADRWVRFSADAGYSEARRELAAIDSARRRSEFNRVRIQAARGDAPSQFQIGKWILTGEASDTNDATEAASWLRRAAEQNYPEAEYELGMLYRDGVGVERNPETAARLLERAAARGLLVARVALQEQMHEQQGFAINPVAAFQDATRFPFYRAAIAGDANAQFELGLMYFNGDADVRDARQGVFWMRKSAEQDNVNAQLFLADCYARGIEISGDFSEAMKWYRRAARLGNAAAQQRLDEVSANARLAAVAPTGARIQR